MSEGAISYPARPCPLCGGNQSTPALTGGPRCENLALPDLQRLWNSDMFNERGFFSYSRCKGCGLLYCPQYPDDNLLGKLYSGMSPNMSELPLQALEETQRGYLKGLLRRGLPEGDVLETGPDRGLLAREIAALPGPTPRTFWFIEPNRHVHQALADSVSPAKTHLFTDLNDYGGIPVAIGALASFVHVLDHLTDPLHHLREIHLRLKPGGLLNIVVHNERSLLAILFGKKLPIFCPLHPQLYNRNTLSQIAARAGFDVLSVRSTVNFYPASFLIKNLFYRLGLSLFNIPAAFDYQMPMPLGNLQLIARKH